ncbi:MAG: hypothetical protein QKV96_gp26 [Methanophagales virus GBV303]|uniref:Uncharacterized protein n=1 Tax=Methanophagales virus GBV303 TaxID=2986514 RepID=A0A9E8V8E1_9VIRU|nr:MAG: hypothetical protein QKV96_gp26 [Methanophagales virus GBV303]WAE39662.1 MAG: hypothetical protein NNKAGPMP_00026 [Methanophagales virus GBV303]
MPKVPCPVCGKEVEKRALHMHMRTHEKEMRNQMSQNQMERTKVSNPSEMVGEEGERAVERMRGVGKKGLDILNAWDEAYHKLLPDLWCVINNNGDAYITPVLALHINSDGGWIAICDREGKVRKVEDLNGECILCTTRREAEKVLNALRNSEKQQRKEGLLEKFVKRFQGRVQEWKRRRREKVEVRQGITPVNEETVIQLISALREFSAKTEKERRDRGVWDEE